MKAYNNLKELMNEAMTPSTTNEIEVYLEVEENSEILYHVDAVGSKDFYESEDIFETYSNMLNILYNNKALQKEVKLCLVKSGDNEAQEVHKIVF